ILPSALSTSARSVFETISNEGMGSLLYGCRSSRLFLRFLKTDGGPVLFRPLQMPGVPGEENRRLIVIIGERRLIGIDEFLHLAVILRLDPARRVKLGRLACHRDIIFGADAVGQHFELQAADNADYPVGAKACLENARRPLLRELEERAAEMLGAHRIERADALQQFRREAR